MSTIKCTTIQNLSGVEVYTAKAWVNFSGISTITIRDSGNVSSITDNGVGNYNVNFTNDMVDSDYAVSGWANADTPTGTLSGYFVSGSEVSYFRTSSSIRIGTWSVGNGHTLQDLPQVNVVIFR